MAAVHRQLNASLRLAAAFERTDRTEFQRRARLLQALWRAERGYPIGTKAGKSRGAMLERTFAEETLANFLTPNIQAVVRREVMSPERDKGKLYGKPRIYTNLLSSQPLCFNLFAELSLDLPAASAAFATLTDNRIVEVERIDFEHSPGRRDPKYTGDRSAFDVFVVGRGADGSSVFAGIEVKYHENLRDKAAEHRDRCDQIADGMGCFAPHQRPALQQKPLQQIWRDHLLVGSMLFANDYADGFFVFLYPEDNPDCADAVRAYQACLTNDESFTAWTLEDVVAAIRGVAGTDWIEVVADRYLGWHRIDALLAEGV